MQPVKEAARKIQTPTLGAWRRLKRNGSDQHCEKQLSKENGTTPEATRARKGWLSISTTIHSNENYYLHSITNHTQKLYNQLFL